MKATILLRALCWGLAAWLLNPAQCSAEPAALPDAAANVLKVRINVPAGWLILGDENMSDVLTDRLRLQLQQNGFAAQALGPVDDTGSAAYLLTIDLTEWRLDARGYAHGALEARLKTPQATYQLGPYSSSTMEWMRSARPFRLSSAFEAAAEAAVNRLVDDLVHLDALAGLRSDHPSRPIE